MRKGVREALNCSFCKAEELCPDDPDGQEAMHRRHVKALRDGLPLMDEYTCEHEKDVGYSRANDKSLPFVDRKAAVRRALRARYARSNMKMVLQSDRYTFETEEAWLCRTIHVWDDGALPREAMAEVRRLVGL